MPANALAGLQSAMPRLTEIEEYWRQYPGAAPGGSGPTGLLPNDAKGWSDLMNMQTEYANLKRQLSGEGPLQVRGAPLEERRLGPPPPSTMFARGQTSAVPEQSPFSQQAALAALKKLSPQRQV